MRGSLDMSWETIVVKNRRAFPRSRSPFLKKKLALSFLLLANNWAAVREIVDLPVPAMPCSQKMHWP
jgi:hypothetical protein